MTYSEFSQILLGVCHCAHVGAQGAPQSGHNSVSNTESQQPFAASRC